MDTTGEPTSQDFKSLMEEILPAPADGTKDPNELLRSMILGIDALELTFGQKIAELEAVLHTFEARMSQAERWVAFLLDHSPEFKAFVEKAKVAAEQKETSNDGREVGQTHTP